MNDELFLIDTNILVYMLDGREPQKQKVSRGMIELCWYRNKEYAVSVQNLNEFYMAVTSKFENKVPKETAKLFVETIVDFENWKVIAPNADTIVSAMNINERYNLNYWDALLAATMQENKIVSIYTEVKQFERLPWLTVINPMEQTCP